MPPHLTWESIPSALLADLGQLVKAGSILGNKKDNVTIIYTPASNLLKTGAMETGSVSFKNERMVRRFHVKERENAIVNRLAKTKVERMVDHEAERVEQEKGEARQKRDKANELVSAQLCANERRCFAGGRSFLRLWADCELLHLRLDRRTRSSRWRGNGKRTRRRGAMRICIPSRKS